MPKPSPTTNLQLNDEINYGSNQTLANKWKMLPRLKACSKKICVLFVYTKKQGKQNFENIKKIRKIHLARKVFVFKIMKVSAQSHC